MLSIAIIFLKRLLETFMNRLLKPNKLKMMPEDPSATKVFEYWFKIFENFYLLLRELVKTKHCKSTCLAKKLLVASNLYCTYISETTNKKTYTIILLVLLKEKNVTFFRYLLITRLQS